MSFPLGGLSLNPGLGGRAELGPHARSHAALTSRSPHGSRARLTLATQRPVEPSPITASGSALGVPFICPLSEHGGWPHDSPLPPTTALCRGGPSPHPHSVSCEPTLGWIAAPPRHSSPPACSSPADVPCPPRAGVFRARVTTLLASPNPWPVSCTGIRGMLLPIWGHAGD